MVRRERMPLRIERLNRRTWAWRRFLRRHEASCAQVVAVGVLAALCVVLLAWRMG